MRRWAGGRSATGSQERAPKSTVDVKAWMGRRPWRDGESRERDGMSYRSAVEVGRRPIHGSGAEDPLTRARTGIRSHTGVSLLGDLQGRAKKGSRTPHAKTQDKAHHTKKSHTRTHEMIILFVETSYK